jgi:ankyrin repeat protein
MELENNVTSQTFPDDILINNIAYFLDFTTNISLFTTCKTYHKRNNIIAVLSREEFNINQHFNALVTYSQNNDKEIVQLIINKESDENKEERKNILLFFGYKDPNNIEENIRAYKGWNADSNKLNEDALIPNIKTFSNDKLSAIRVLLKNNANVNIKCDSGCSALYWGVLKGHIEVVKILLKYNACIHDTNKNKTPLLHAASKEIIPLLLEAGADINAKDDRGYTVLYRRTLANDIKALELLLSKGADIQCITKYGQSLLHAATSRIDIMKLLIEKGIKVDTQDNNGKTPLYKCVEEHIHAYKRAAVELLLSAGADIHCINNDGESLLHAAIFTIDIMELLIVKGIRLDTQDNNGKTALYKSVEENRYGHMHNTIEVLLSAGARDLPIKDNNQPRTALDLAKSINYSHIETLLLNHCQEQ